MYALTLVIAAATIGGTKPQPLTTTELYKLASAAIRHDGAVKGSLVNAHLIVAIALQESSGRPWVVGRNGEVGLGQFKKKTWFDCWKGAAVPKGKKKLKTLPPRTDPAKSMIAIYRHLRWGERRLHNNGQSITRRRIASFHNVGNWKTYNRKYANEVQAKYRRSTTR